MSTESRRRIVLFGGGRWARVLLSVLNRVRPAETEILWVTKHSQAAAQNWLSDNPVENVQLTPDVDLQSADASAVIIATSPESHFHLAEQSVKLGLPTLCEKPIAPDRRCVNELLDLSRKSRVPLGIHLELLYASYLEDFAMRLRTDRDRSAEVRSVHIEWLDPWCEQRGDDTKYAEFYTDIVNDQFPHCWSILATIFPSATSLQVHDVELEGNNTSITGTCGPAVIRCRLSRRAASRVRRVIINEGEWVLDFSNEPGVVIHAGGIVVNQWNSDRPLSRSLTEFLLVSLDPRKAGNWRLSLTNSLPAIEASLVAAARLQTIQDQWIQRRSLKFATDFADVHDVQLIVDRFVPEFAAKGLRLPVRTTKEQLEFARVWQSSRK